MEILKSMLKNGGGGGQEGSIILMLKWQAAEMR